MHEVVKVGNLVHVHHNGDTSTRWGYVTKIVIENGYLVGPEVLYTNHVRHVVPPQYVNRALLGLDGPICLNCTREALTTR